MRLINSGSRETRILRLPNGVEILFSYELAVAGFIPTKGYFRTDKHYSTTTSRHINDYLGPSTAQVLNQAAIDRLLG